MSKYKNLKNNIILFFLANMGSKLVTFVLVPFYTHALSTAEYGTADIIVSTTSLLVPFATWGMGDVITMYLIKREFDYKSIVSNSVFLLILGNIILCIFYPLIGMIQTFSNYVWLFAMLVITQSLYGILQSYARGIDKTVAFAASGMIYTLCLVSLNIYFLTVAQIGVKGYLLSMVLAYSISNFYLLVSTKMLNEFSIIFTQKRIIKNILKLAIPLLPNSVLWWLMNLCDKYSILYFLGADSNGLYSVANKLPTVIAVAYGIFQQAWQLTSMTLDNKDKRSEMYSEMFEILSGLLACVASILIIICKPYITIFCDSTYAEAWKVTPFLIMSSICNSISSFFGSNYILMRNTFAALKVTIVGTIINACMNIILINIIGLQGAAIATCLGFLYMDFKKAYDTRGFTPLKVHPVRLVKIVVLLFLETMIVLLVDSLTSYFLGAAVFGCIVLLYRDIIAKIGIAFLKSLKNKLNS